MPLSLIPNRLFIKLLLGFWLCSSLIIVLVGLLPLLQQNHDRAALPPKLESILIRAAKHIQQEPQLLAPGALKRWERRRELDGKPIRLYLLDQHGRAVSEGGMSRGMRRFMLMAEEANKPISHQFKDELIFGPHAFTVGSENYTLYGRLPDHHPMPWFFFFTENKLLTLGLAVLLSGILCALLAWHLGKPLRSLKQSADALARGDLTSRVDATTTERKDELGQLANAFNSMADAIEATVNSQQRLMSDISHELRTPLTRLQLALALARKKGQQSAETERIAYEAEQLDNLIGELLELSRVKLNANNNRIHLSLAESLSQVLDDAEFEAAQQQKHIIINIDEALTLPHYPRALSRAVENVLRNAMRYANSTVILDAKLVNEHIEITIADDGPGVESKELEAIFKPFYRPDSARERESGGWGLGLAITEAAINAHQGHIWAENIAPHGLKVSIRLPT